MGRRAVDSSERLALRIQSSDKATIRRAAALQQTDITSFVVQTALREAEAVIERSERVKLSHRDSVRVLDLLANPPAPNARLRQAARNLPPET